MDTLNEDQYTFLSYLAQLMRNVSDKSCREYQNTHFMFNNFFPLENIVVFETMLKNLVQPDRPQTTM
jgi:hypothetical protein